MERTGASSKNNQHFTSYLNEQANSTIPFELEHLPHIPQLAAPTGIKVANAGLWNIRQAFQCRGITKKEMVLMQGIEPRTLRL